MLLNIISESFKLLVSFDKELYDIIFFTLEITVISTIIASCISIPLAIAIDFMNIKLKRVLVALLNSMLALPTVVIGLFVYMVISQSGPVGSLNLLFTPYAMIIGQTILAIPIITSFTLAGFSKTDLLLHETMITLGATKIDMVKTLIYEHKSLMLSSVLGGFGRVISEVGIAMMLGGNIRWFTRTMTTAIALETSKGDYALGLALGLILMAIAIIINFAVHFTLKGESILRST